MRNRRVELTRASEPEIKSKQSIQVSTILLYPISHIYDLFVLGSLGLVLGFEQGNVFTLRLFRLPVEVRLVGPTEDVVPESTNGSDRISTDEPRLPAPRNAPEKRQRIVPLVVRMMIVVEFDAEERPPVERIERELITQVLVEVEELGEVAGDELFKEGGAEDVCWRRRVVSMIREYSIVEDPRRM